MVRVHSNIGREAWARLWYWLRGLDDGSGRVKEIPLVLVRQILGVNQATVYRWLKDGKRVGAFRHYKVRRGLLTVYLGGLFAVAWHLNLRNWGVTANCYLWEVNANIRALTTGIVTQRRQQQSRYAVNRNFKPEYRKLYGAPHPNELLGAKGQSSPKLAAGEIPFCIHASETRLFVSRNFAVFGASQKSIALNLGIHPRTVRRHQRSLNMTRRQICQAKYEYHQLKVAWEHEATECQAWAADGTQSTNIGYKAGADAIAFEDGHPAYVKKQRISVFGIPKGEFAGRFFKIGSKVYMNRCNLYREEIDLTTMSSARRKYRYKLSQCHFQENRAGLQGDA